MTMRIGFGSAVFMTAAKCRHSTRLLTIAVAALALFAGVQTASATWLTPPGATSGDSYSAGNGYDYLAPANWNGGTIDDNFSTLGLTGALTISLNADRTTAGGLNLTLTGASDFSLLSDGAASRAITLGGNVTADVTDGSQTITIGATARPVTINLNNNTRTFTVGSGDTNIINGVISSSTASSGKLTKDGSGVLTLNAVSTYTGLTTVNGGELRYGIANAIAAGGSVSIANGATLNVGNYGGTVVNVTLNKGGTFTGGTANFTQTGAFTLADGGTVNGFNGTTSGFFNLGGNLSYTSSGASSVMATINRLGAGGATRSLTIVRGSDPSGVDMDITEVLMGNGNFNLTKAGAGVLRLSGSTASSGRGTGTTAINDGTVLLNKSASVEAIGGSGTITIGDNTGTAGSAVLQHVTGSADNQILNNAVTINGDGLWDLNGHNETTSGTLTISRNGQVDLNGGNLSVGALAIVATSGSGNTTPIKNTAGSGSLTMTTLGITPLAATTSTISLNGATATLGGNVTFTAATTGQAQITGGTLALGGNRTFNVGAGSGTTYDFDINVPITGSGNTLQQITSAGRLQFSGSGANTYNGLTTVSAGTLLLAKSGVNAIGGNLTVSGGTARLTGTGGDQIPNTANVVVSSGTFDLNGLNETVNGVQQTGGTMQGGAGILTSSTAYDMQAGTVSAILDGSVGLTKTTAGTVTLSGANAYTGPTAVNAGTLLVNSPGSLAAGSAVTVATGATLGGSGNINGTVAVNSVGTLAGTITIGGTVTAAASGIISPAGNGAAGTLNLANAGNALTLNGNALYCDVSSTSGSSDLIQLSNGTGNLVINGKNTIYLTLPAGGLANGNTYTLMTYASKSGSGSIVLQNGSLTMGNLTLTVGATSVTLTVGGTGYNKNVWKGSASSIWNATDSNWAKNGVASPLTTYADPDEVLFDDTATAGYYTVSGSASPGFVTVNNSTTDYTISAEIGGSGALIKNGTKTLSLTGANMFGDVFINAGVLKINSAGNLGSGNIVTFTGTSTLEFLSSATLSQGFVINAGVTGTLRAGNQNVTINNPLAGSGTLFVYGTSTSGINLTFTSTNNTFSGDIQIRGDGASYPSSLTMASLDDTPGRRIKLGANNSTIAFTYGAGAVVPLVLSNRQIEHYTSAEFGATLNNNATNVNCTVMVNTDLIVTGGSKPFTLGGSNSGNNTFAGAITNVTNLTKANPGNWILSNTNNSYTGTTTVSGGTLSINSIMNVGAGQSAVGAPTTVANGTIAIGNGGTAGTLQYTGSGHTTDRVISLAGSTGGAILDQSGTGLLKFTSDFTAPGAASSDRRKTLTLQGSTAGIGEIAGAIPNSTLGNAGQLATSLTKSGGGTWVLSGANTYTGPTTVNGGKLLIKNTTGSGTGSGAVTVNGGILGGNGTITGAVTVANNAILAPADLNTIAKLTLGSTLTLTGSTLKFDLTDATTEGTTYDQIAVTGTLTMSGANIIHLNATGGSIATGTYNLLTCATSTASTFKFPDGTTSMTIGSAILTLNNSTTGLQLVVSGAPAVINDLVWDGTSGSTWDSGSNWFINGTTTSTNFNSPNSVTFDDAGVATATIISAGTVQPSSVLFNNYVKNYTVSAAIGGTAALTKWGTSTTTLLGNNSYSGATTVGGGTLQLAHTNAIGSSSALSLATGTALQLRSDSTDTFTNTRMNPAGTVGINVDNTGSGTGNTLTLGGTVVYVSSASSQINFTGGNTYNAGINAMYINSGNNGNTFTLNPTTASAVIGNIRVNTSTSNPDGWGAGTSANINLFLGGTGTSNTISSVAEISNTGTQLSITKNTAATWILGNVDTKQGNNHTMSAGTLTLNGTFIFAQANDRKFTLSGGVLNYNNAGAIQTHAATTSGNGFVIISGGSLDNTSGAAIDTSTTNPRMTWGGDWAFIGANGANSDLNLGTGAVFLTGTRQVTVQNAATTLTVGGVISGATFGLTKAGPGTLKLSGANTYTGTTTISAGTLALGTNNALPSASAIVMGAGTLDMSTYTNSVNTLNVTGAATINLGSGGKLFFADSSGVNSGTWDGTLTITGAFVSRSSIKFGTSAGGLTAAQLSKISIPGGRVGIDANGYLELIRPTVISFF